MIHIVVACDKNNGIGKNNKLPWHIPEDLRYFKNLTKNHTVVMGRKTYESIYSMIKKPLPNRYNVVLSSQNKLLEGFDETCIMFDNPREIININRKFHGKNIFVIGGSEIYKEFLPHAERIYVTRIMDEFDVDKFFPHIDEDTWKLVSRKRGLMDGDNLYEYYFDVFNRIQ